jgi:hypothetical protein
MLTDKFRNEEYLKRGNCLQRKTKPLICDTVVLSPQATISVCWLIQAAFMGFLFLTTPACYNERKSKIASKVCTEKPYSGRLFFAERTGLKQTKKYHISPYIFSFSIYVDEALLDNIHKERKSKRCEGRINIVFQCTELHFIVLHYIFNILQWRTLVRIVLKP